MFRARGSFELRQPGPSTTDMELEISRSARKVAIVFRQRRPAPKKMNNSGPVQFMHQLHHLSDADLTRRQLDSITGLELAIVEEHLRWCEYCTDRAGDNLRPCGRMDKLT